ncbi:MAG: ferritin-like domain-containing protein [Candidatus Bathyarchaeia archaeon]
MSTSRRSLEDFIREQMRIENDIVKSLETAIVDMKNPSVKNVLRGISLDSLKHLDMYSSALTLLTSTSQALSQEQFDKQRELIERHIQLEANLINRINEVLPSVEDRKVKLLLEAILADEKRHHELLVRVLEILIRGETITEDEWWDILWRNAPFHGAPGG